MPASLLDCLAPAALDALLARPPVFCLWWRAGRGRPWEVVASAATESDCVQRIGTGGRRNGDWLTLPAGRTPDKAAKGC